jgi:predicted permease
MQFHFDQQIAENIAAGMGREEAHYAAVRAFGNPTLLKEETKETWGWIWLEQFTSSLRYAVRTLSRAPGFSFVAVLVIALGIGATASLFTIVRSVLLKPLPFKDSSRLLRLYEHSFDDKFPYNQIAAGVFAEWKKQSQDFSDMALLSRSSEYGFSGTSGQLPEKVRASECTWNLFQTLGVGPALGRSFTAAEDRQSATAVVILSWGFWKRRFGGDPSILNQTIHLDAKPYTVVGIMPSWFAYPEQSTQVWTTVYHERSDDDMQALGDHGFIAVGRLKPGATETQATEELSLIVRRIHDQHLDNPFVSKAANSRPLLEDIVGDIKTPLYVLLAATGCVLLIACLNVANLVVARAASRRKELAVRAALGGSRRRLLSEHLTETFLLTAAGGGVGVILAYAVIQWFVETRQDVSRVEAIHIDGVVAAFVLGLILFCAVFAGMISSLSIDSDRILLALQESSRAHSAGPGSLRLRKWLLSLEVGLTVVLLISAGLLLKSYEHLRSSNLGCITNNVLTMRISLRDAKYSQPGQRVNFFEALLDRVRSLPSVRVAGLVTAVPGSGYEGDSGFEIAEHPPLPLGLAQFVITRWVDPQYFTALGIPLLRGQTFGQGQRLDKVNEVIISESFARQYFGEEEPLGKHLLTNGNHLLKIVGVVGDTRYLITEPTQPIMYFSIYDGSLNSATLAVRSSLDVTSLASPIQQIVGELDPDLPVSDVLTMDQIVGKSTLDASFDATLVLAFAVLSMVLAAVGLFGVLSYVVAQRTSEIGIRVALGAQRGQILRLVLSDGLLPAGVGLIFGLAGGVAASKMIGDLLYGLQPLDPSVFAAVAIILLAVAGAASVLPAWRASRLDPTQALRNE